MQAAVIHYNGNMKPWLEIAITKYKPHWSKYVKFDHPYLQQCNINEWECMLLIVTGLQDKPVEGEETRVERSKDELNWLRL